jgi:hypothetical protein
MATPFGLGVVSCERFKKRAPRSLEKNKIAPGGSFDF